MENIKKIIQESTSIVITTHKSPDGDAIGSSLALYHFLKKYTTKNIKVVVPDSFPNFLNWMAGTADIIYHDAQQEMAEELINNSNLLFILDCNAPSRVGNLAEVVKNTQATKIVIDHHQNPQEFANHYLVDSECCSTSQLIYELIEKLNALNLLDKNMASCIYCGIMTDTGSFRFPSTTAKTHQIAGHLIKLGVDGAKIHEEVFDTYSEKRLRLLGYALTNKMKVFKNLNAAYISLTQKELKEFNFKKGDTEGLVNYPLSINGIKFSALITEKEKDISLSLRSKGNFYVNEFANKHFEGGGHIYASGGKSDLTFEETVAKFEKLLLQYKDELIK